MITIYKGIKQVEDNTLKEISQRLNNLENKNRNLRFVNLLLLSIIVLGGLAGWQATTQFFQTIETEKLVLKDKEGKIRATLCVDEHNEPMMKFFNSDSIQILALGDADGSGFIRLSEENILDNTIKSAVISPDEFYLEINGKSIVEIFSGNQTIFPMLRFSDLKGNVRSAYTSSNNDSATGGIFWNNTKQQLQASLQGAGALQFYRDTVQVMQLIAMEGFNSLTFRNKQNTNIMEITSNLLYSRFILRDLDGKEIFRLGDDLNQDLSYKLRGLEIYDGNGNTATILGTTVDGEYSTMQLFTDNKALLYLTTRPERSMIAIDDKKENPIVVIESGVNYDSPIIGIRKNEKFVFKAGIDDNDFPYQYIYDKYGKVRFDMSFTDYGKPAISLYDASGSRRGVFGATSIKYNNGTTKNHPESSIWLFNESGNGIFSAPND